MTSPTPGAAPKTPAAQGQIMTHLQASQMAFKAAKNAAVSKMLATGVQGAPKASPMAAPAIPTPGPTSFKNQVMGMAKQKGMKKPTPAHVHGAIDALTNVGRFSPGIGAALKAHDGPLQGPGGDATMNDISTAMPAMNPGA